MPGVIVVYLGLVTMFVGGVSVIRPLKFLSIGTRPQGLAVFAVGLVIVIIGGSLPAKEFRVTSPRTQLDQFMPAWQFNEFHSIRIPAPREKVYTALKQVTADEITFFRTLVWLRRLGRPGPESILNPPPNAPLLEVATRTQFIVLADEPNQEFVVGTLVAAPRGWRPSGKPAPDGFKSLFDSQKPGFALAAMNFHLEDCAASARAGISGKAGLRAGPAAPGAQLSVAGTELPSDLERNDKTEACTLLTTETRIYATDAPTRRAFARYWRVIYPGSSLIRRMWLRAVAKRTSKN
jgi:hypothetical protein